MIRRMLCWLIGHDDRTRQDVWFDASTTKLHLCHRCGRMEWL